MDNIASTAEQAAKYRNSPKSPFQSSVMKRRQSPSRERSIDKRQRTIQPSTKWNKNSRYLRENNQQNRDDPSPQLRPLPITQVVQSLTDPFSVLPPSPPKALDGLNFQDVLNEQPASLGSNQMKAIHRWMWQHNTRTVKGYEFEFKLLLAALGFSNSSFSPQLIKLLSSKVHKQVQCNSKRLKRLGAYTVVWDKQKKKVPQFAEWAEGWMSKTWDGSPARPRWTQLFLNPYFGESRGWLHMRAPVSLNDEADTHVSPERFVVVEPNAMGPHPFSNTEPKGSFKTYGTTQEPHSLTFESFKFLYSTSSTISKPSYSIDVSQLPQYHGVQLTANDPYHPRRPHSSFIATGSYFDKAEYDGEVRHGEDIEENHVDDDTVSDGREISGSETTIC